MSGIRFHDTVMTPNGPGIVQGLLTRPGKPDSLLISHEPKVFAPAELLQRTGERISAEPEQDKPVIWLLFAYPPSMIKPIILAGAR